MSSGGMRVKSPPGGFFGGKSPGGPQPRGQRYPTGWMGGGMRGGLGDVGDDAGDPATGNPGTDTPADSPAPPADSPGPTSPPGPSSMGDDDPALTAATAPPADDPSDPGFAISPPPAVPTDIDDPTAKAPKFGPAYAFSRSPTGRVGHQPGMTGFNPAGVAGNSDPNTGFSVGFDVSNPNDPTTMALMAQMAVPGAVVGKSAVLGAVPGASLFGFTPGNTTASNIAHGVGSVVGSSVPGASSALGAGVAAANATISALAADLGISTDEAAAAPSAGHGGLSAGANANAGQSGGMNPLSAGPAGVSGGFSRPTGPADANPATAPGSRSPILGEDVDARRRSGGFRLGV